MSEMIEIKSGRLCALSRSTVVIGLALVVLLTGFTTGALGDDVESIEELSVELDRTPGDYDGSRTDTTRTTSIKSSDTNTTQRIDGGHRNSSDRNARSQSGLTTIVYSFQSNTILKQNTANPDRSTGYQNNSHDTELEPPGIIDGDDRKRIKRPWESSNEAHRATVQITSEFSKGGDSAEGSCSGAIVGEFHVLTAAHCVYDDQVQDWIPPLTYGWADSVSVTPTADNISGEDIEPFSSADVRLARVYKEFTDEGSKQHDFALLTLDRSVGDYIDPLNWGAYSADDGVYQNTMSVPGYPADPPQKTGYPSMWEDEGPGQQHHCTIVQCYEKTVAYEIDASVGQSGSPVVRWDSTAKRWEILGVFAYTNKFSDYNFGPRVTFDKATDLSEWIDDDMNGKYVNAPKNKPEYVFEDIKFTGEKNKDWFQVSPTNDLTPGETELTLEHTVRNVGTANTANSIQVTANLLDPYGGKIQKLDSTEIDPPSPFSTTDVTLSAVVPSELTTGDYKVQMKIESLVPEFENYGTIKQSSTQKVTVDSSNDPDDSTTLTASPSSWELGSIASGSTHTRTVTVENTGGSDTDITVSGGSGLSVSGVPNELAAGESASFTATLNADDYSGASIAISYAGGESIIPISTTIVDEDEYLKEETESIDDPHYCTWLVDVWGPDRGIGCNGQFEMDWIDDVDLDEEVINGFSEATLQVEFATDPNNGAQEHPLEVYLNGNQIGSLQSPPGGGEFETRSISISESDLSEGDNEFKLTTSDTSAYQIGSDTELQYSYFEEPDLLLDFAEYPQEVEPGTAFVLPVNVENDGGLPAENVVLGVGSLDSGLEILDFPDGFGAGGSSKTLEPGEIDTGYFTVELTQEVTASGEIAALSDNAGIVDETFTVEAPNEPPTFTSRNVSPESVSPNEDVSFSVELDDPDGDLVDVTLEVYHPSTGTWQTYGTQTVGGSGTADFTESPFSGDDIGETGQFRFQYEDDFGNSGTWGPFAGPTVTNPNSEGPSFSNWQYPATVAPGQNIDVSVEISDPDGVASAELEYVYPDGTIGSTALSQDGLVWSATLPAPSGTGTGSTIELTAEATDGNQYPKSSQSSPQYLTIEFFGTILGTVTNENGKTIQGATVSAVNDTAVVRSTTTDINGEYSLTVAPGDYTIEIEKDGFEPFSSEVVISEGQEINRNVTLVELEPSLTAGFTITPENPTVGEQLTFNGDPSTPESDIQSYDWTLGDGTTATGKQVTHTYTDSGQFTVELTVQNGTETDTATETVSISPPSDSVEISDWADLDDIRNNPDADYVLVNDLDETTPGYETVAGPNANGGKGFAPIGGFTGSFDGQENRIANLTIDRSDEDYVGLFGDISGSAAIEEVILTGATVTGSDFVGGLVGFNDFDGTVSNSSASSGVNGYRYVGGLVGVNNGGTVSNSSASGAVNGSKRVGGLVGVNDGTVSNSSASGAVNGFLTGSLDVGGLVGVNNGGTVSDSSATGGVNAPGSGSVGGLVGANVEGTVSESFATGAVTGSTNVGGLVGQLGVGFTNPGQEAILRDSYYDTQTTGQQAAVGTIEEGNGTAELRGEVVGLPTSQMQGASAAQNLDALDFTNTWRVVTSPPGYPELRSLPDGSDPPLTAAFNVTPEDPTAGEQLTLDADPSTPESDIQSYDWTLGDGTTATGKQVTHTYTDSGQFTVELTVQDGTETDTATKIMTVNEPAAFDVTITSVDSAVAAGEVVMASYEVTNTGDVQATQNINFAVNGSIENTESGVTLNGGETVSGQFSYTTGSADTPAVSVAVASEDDSASETVTVNDPAVFDVTITSVNSAVTAGEMITASYEVTNTGDVQATQDIEFTVNGTAESTEAGVTLNGSETFSGQFSYTTGSADTPAVSVAVASNDDSASETVTVNDPAVFDVTITSVDSAVTEGETTIVAYEVTNTGDVQATQDIDFAVNGTTEDTASGVTLNGSETFSNQFTYNTAAGDAPAVNVAVLSADDSASETVTVNEPASFDVTVTSVDSAVTEGDDVTVEYQVENTGGQSGTQAIEFLVNGTVESTQTVTLDDGELRSNSFTYTTVTGDAPELTTEVRSENDTDTATVAVNESPPNFEVNITDTPVEVTEGDDVTVEYQVENTGGQSGTQAIEFLVNGTVESTQTVTLDDGELRSNSFTYTTVTGDAPELTTEVRSENDTDTATVAVNESPPNFEVNITDTPVEVTEGDDVTVEYQVENTGGQSGTQAIEFLVDGTVEGTQTVTLDGEEISSNSFTYTTVTGDAPELITEVRSANDTDTATVAVNESPPNFEVNITDTPVEVTEGDDVTVEYQVENTGEQSGTQAIEFLVDGIVEGTQTVTLDDGELRSDSFTYTTVKGDAPELTTEVRSENDTDTATVAVNESPPNFEVNITDTPVEVTEGDEVTVEYQVENTGGQSGTQAIEFLVDGTVEGTQTVTLNGEEITSNSFTYTTVTGDAPELITEVRSENDTDTATVAVNESPPNFEVNITDTPVEVTEGDDVTVEYQVENTGEQSGTQAIEFLVDGTVEGTQTVTLNGEEITSNSFTYDTVAGDAPAVSVTVSSADDSATETVTVDTPNASVSFDDQATASSTFTSDTPSEPGVVVGPVDSDVDSAVVVTYPETGLQSGDKVTIDLDNVGFQAWEINGVSGDADSVEDIVVDDINNPTLRLVEGVEYTFEGLPGSNHPLEFFDANGDALLSQDGDGSYEDDPAVGWTDSGNSVSFTATSGLTADFDGYRCTIHSSSMVGDTTSTAATDLIIAGLETLAASDLDGGSVAVPVNDLGGFPGNHTAHIVPTADLSGTYSPGDVVSDETASAIIDNETATVFQGTLDFANQSYESPTTEVTAATATLTGDPDTLFVVNLHETTATGAPGAYVGASAVLSGSNQDVAIPLRDSDGNTVEFDTTNEYIAMIHVVDNESVSEGDLRPPGTFPILPHGSPNGVVPGGVTDPGTVTVNEPASFDVTITSVDSAVTAGEIVTASYEVTNTGAVQATQDINFSINGTVNDTESDVTLNGSETFSGQFTYDTVAGDAPAVTVTVSSAGNSDSNTVTVNEPSSLVVEIDDAIAPGEGVPVGVAVTVQNTGDTEQTQSVTLDVEGLGSDATNVTLSGGESTTVTLFVETVEGDAGTYNITVTGGEESVETTVEVPVELSPVPLPGTSGPPTDTTGDGLHEDVDGDGEFNIFDVAVLFDNLDSLAVQLQAELFEFAGFPKERAAVGIVDVQALSEELTPGQGTGLAGNLTVSVEPTTGPVPVGEETTVDVVVEGASDGLAALDFEVAVTNGTLATVTSFNESYSTSFSRSGVRADGGTASVEAALANQTLEPGTHTIGTMTIAAEAVGETSIEPTVGALPSGLFSQNLSSYSVETETANLTVKPPGFAVDILATNTPVAGEDLIVTTLVENPKSTEDTETIGLDAGNLGTDTTQVTLGGGNTTELNLSVSTEAEQAGGYAVTVNSATDSTSANVTVTEPASFEVTITSVDSTVTEGETITIAYEVTNTGDVQDTQNVTFAVNGTTEDTEPGVTLNGSETFSGQFSYDTVAGDAPALSVTVASEDDSATETVTVNEPASFDVIITSVESEVTEGETITMAYEVTNVGDVEDTQNVRFAVNGTTEDTESGVTLNGSETFSGQFSYSTSDADTPAVSVTVSSKDTTASADVIVRGASGLVVTNLTTPAAVTVGDSLNFTATVSNPGTSSITQQFNLTVNGTTVDTTTVSLDGGNATTVQLTWQTGAGDDGNATVRLSGSDAAATTNITVDPLTVADYADENGIVTTLGLFDAIEDWQQDLIETQLLLDVIAAWRSDKPV